MKPYFQRFNINTNQQDQRSTTNVRHSLNGEDHTSVPPTTIVDMENEYVQENDEADEATAKESLMIPWDKIMLGKTVLGAGNFGEVREGVVWLKDKAVKVAIKYLKGKLNSIVMVEPCQFVWIYT